jgi:hypothetical protein
VPLGYASGRERRRVDAQHRILADGCTPMSAGIVRSVPAGSLSVEKARDILAKARGFDEVKHVRDVAVAMAAYARAAKAGKAAQLDSAEIILRADRRLGELDAQVVPTKTGGRNAKPVRATDGMDRQRAYENRRIAALPEKDLDSYASAARRTEQPVTIAGAVTLSRLDASERREVLAKLGEAQDIRRAIGEVKRTSRLSKIETIARGNAPMGAIAERFPIVYADPPWQYELGPDLAEAIGRDTASGERHVDIEIAEPTRAEILSRVTGRR